MRKLILNTETVLIVDAEVYHLVREKEQSKNDVCQMCSLYDQCGVEDGTLRFFNLCIPMNGDEGWFFTTNVALTPYKARELVKLVNETFYI
ncbi:MAG: hypothetical protein IJI83_03730 [Oscillospiraceae bacterium]|nr:hypothetical protein [Oscillospiraceae bacterium]MBR0341905.1 hypothetical protein [Oscillospiraceae bacterium]